MLYTLTTPDVAQLLLNGRRLLAALWSEQQDLLTTLQDAGSP